MTIPNNQLTSEMNVTFQKLFNTSFDTSFNTSLITGFNTHHHAVESATEFVSIVAVYNECAVNSELA